jgi:hypothetical protein
MLFAPPTNRRATAPLFGDFMPTVDFSSEDETSNSEGDEQEMKLVVSTPTKYS